MQAVMALSKDEDVIISDGLRSSMTMSTMRFPASLEISHLLELSTGSVLNPRGIIPIASSNPFIVEAVPIVLHEPKPQLKDLPISSHSSWVILPILKSSQYFHKSVPLPSFLPLKTPGFFGPPFNCIAGRFA